MPYHIVRRHKTGSTGDDFNDGRLGQFRSIENTRGAYFDQINKELRAKHRWLQEQELRIQCNEGMCHPPGSPRAVEAPQPLVTRDIFGNVTTLIPRRNYSSRPATATSRLPSVNNNNGNQQQQKILVASSPPARTSHFIAMPKQSFLPKNIPLTTSEIAASGGSGVAHRNGGWNFNYHRPSSATGTSNSNISTSATNRRQNFRPVDSDDDDAISFASTTLSRKEERDALKSRLDSLEQEVTQSSQQRGKLDSQIDELKELLLAFKKNEKEKRRAIGTFGNLEEPTEITFRAKRAPGIKTGLSGFAAGRKQTMK